MPQDAAKAGGRQIRSLRQPKKPNLAEQTVVSEATQPVRNDLAIGTGKTQRLAKSRVYLRWGQ